MNTSRFARFPKRALVILALCGMPFSNGTLVGAILFDNLDETPIETDGVLGYESTRSLAQRFRTDDSSPQVITDITLKLQRYASDGSGGYKVSLYSDNGSAVPNPLPSLLISEIASGDISELPLTFADVPYSSLSLSVAANTAYWIVVSTDTITDSPQIVWGWVHDPSPPPGAYTAYLNTIAGAEGSWQTLGQDGPHHMQVISAVPEPHESILAAAIGLVAFVCWRSRNFSKQTVQS